MSNVKPFPNIGKIKEEAAQWVVRIHGQVYKSDSRLSKDLSDELEQWMAQSPEHRREFLDSLSSWETMGALESLSDILPLSELNHRNNSLSVFFRSVKSTWIAKPRLSSGIAAACCLLMISAAAFLAPNKSIEYLTEVGAQATYALEDGSSVTLNTDTQIQIDFNANQREIRLNRGEAHFDVAKDPDRPLVVFAGDGMVMAIGTAFNVRHQEDDSVNVVVSEGIVKVFSGLEVEGNKSLLLADSVAAAGNASAENSQRGFNDYYQEVILEAGETAQYSDQGVTKEALEERDVVQALAWTSGTLMFSGETLAQALVEISRYTDRELIILDPEIGKVGVGGRFKTDDIDALAHTLALGLDIETSMGDGGSILFSAK